MSDPMAIARLRRDLADFKARTGMQTGGMKVCVEASHLEYALKLYDLLVADGDLDATLRATRDSGSVR